MPATICVAGEAAKTATAQNDGENGRTEKKKKRKKKKNAKTVSPAVRKADADQSKMRKAQGKSRTGG